MIHAVEEVTIDQGVDPRDAVLVSGGAAAGFNTVAIARRLGCGRLVIPTMCAALSATGGLLSEVFWPSTRRRSSRGRHGSTARR